ncbi:MAG: hypothetical protein V1256_09290, partial [Candidatus Neomarinimicrobiota bacterium]|nr:hypothetical protein [Candidatus Neomarinimicrobiota bacterium]
KQHQYPGLRNAKNNELVNRQTISLVSASRKWGRSLFYILTSFWISAFMGIILLTRLSIVLA